MKIITVTEANQGFSQILKELEETGEAVRVFKRGRPIARIIPDDYNKADDPKWREAYERMMDHLAEGEHLGGLKVNRDDLYER